MRSRSVPLLGSPETACAGINPFWSLRVQEDAHLQAQRPIDLPRVQDDQGEEGLPVQNGVTGLAGVATGKGRGDRMVFTSPNGPTVFVPKQPGMKSEGVMPMETPTHVGETMGSMQTSNNEMNGEIKTRGRVQPPVDELQRDLEVELVEFLRQQNVKLMQEVSDLRSMVHGSGAQAHVQAGCSPWSTADGASLGKSPVEVKRWSSRSPRPTRRSATIDSPVKVDGERHVKKDSQLRCTPNGTRIPEGPPPVGDACDMPMPPPVPPFPTPPSVDAASDMTAKMDFSAYESCEAAKQQRGRIGDQVWKPSQEKSPTPQEAKTL